MNDTTTPVRILYIEDDAGLARLLERHLRRHGYALEWAGDGLAGIEQLQQQHFDIVAIDYEMPGLDGLTVLRRLQSIPNPPPAIMISGAGDMDTAIAAMKAGAADYVAKTVDGSYIDLLPATIDRVLEKQRLKQEAAAIRRALEEKTELLSLTLSSISQGLSVFDRQLRLVAWNELWLHLFDIPAELAEVGVKLEAFASLHARGDARHAMPEIATSIHGAAAGAARTGEYRLDDGRIVEVRSDPMPEGGAVTTYTDITLRRHAAEEQRVAAAVFERSAEPMLITDPQGRIERCNPAFERLLGFDREAVTGRELGSFATESHDSDFFAGIGHSLRQEGHWRGSIWNRHREGEALAQRVTISAIHGATGEVSHYVAVYADITEQVRREEAVRHQAFHDPLTGLPNRTLLMDRITQAMEAAKRDKRGFALLFLDLDGFKPINDTFGHGTGDTLLQVIGRRLVERCRESDTVARYAGDEFVVLLRGCDQVGDVERVTASLIERIRLPVPIKNVEHQVSASFGIAFYPQHGDTAATLLKQADAAMYQAKSAGKGCYRICPPPEAA